MSREALAVGGYFFGPQLAEIPLFHAMISRPNLLAAIALVFCISMLKAQKPDIQGHRGCRGLMPENTLPAFLKAVELGVNTLELDVVMSADGEVVVSHEPWLNEKICLDPKGQPISDGKRFNLYKMTYAEIAQCDCGSLGNSRFPNQAKLPAYKPLLSAVIDSVEAMAAERGLAPLAYNIEVKSYSHHDGIFHPNPDEFAHAVAKVVRDHGVASRTYIQAFDPRPLQTLEHEPDLRLILLIDNARDMETNLAELGFTPYGYSPNYRMVTQKLIRKAHEKGIKVIPWTVNSPKAMERLIRFGVDGIITDYPDQAIELVSKEKP